MVIFIFFLHIKKKSKNENIKYKKKSLMVLNIKNNEAIFSFLFCLAYIIVYSWEIHWFISSMDFNDTLGNSALQ